MEEMGFLFSLLAPGDLCEMKNPSPLISEWTDLRMSC